MDTIIKSANLRSQVVLEDNLIFARTYADDLAQFGSSEQELQY